MKRVLLVNDSRFESIILKDMFEQLDYEVAITDEFCALSEVENFQPELVVVNYIMEETRGDQLIGMIKTGQPEMICLMSSNSQLDRQRFKEAGVDNIMRTPVSMFTLKDLLRRTYETWQQKHGAPEAGDRLCPGCQADISGFSENILFCPFCGEEVN